MIKFLKNVLLPERVDLNYLFPKTVVSVNIGKTSITAAKARYKGVKITIEQILEEIIEAQEEDEEDTDRVVRTLKKVMGQLGNYDEIRSIIPSSLAVFKELKLPFATRDTIEKVIGFEIEPLLPFSLKNAVIDFILVKHENNISDILVTAVQKEHIAQHIALFDAAGVHPDVIMVDTIAFYGMYSRIPEYASLPGGVAVVDIGLYTTRITLMVDSYIKIIRTIPKGIIAIAKKAASDLAISPNEAMEMIIRFGFEESEQNSMHEKLENAAFSLWDDIQFTFTSFSNQFLNNSPLNKALLIGEGSLLKNIIPSLSKKITIPWQEFDVSTIGHIDNVSLNNAVTLTPVNVITVSPLINASVTIDYTVEKDEFILPDYRTFIKQMLFALLLTSGVFFLLFSHYILQKKRLTKELTSSQTEALSTLKAKFKNLENEKTLTDAIDAAEEEVKKQEEMWFAFSNQSKASFLQYLLELTSRIDVKATGIDIEQIVLTEKEMTLKARVRDYDALKILERELSESKLFSYIEPQESLSFSMKIILAPHIEE